MDTKYISSILTRFNSKTKECQVLTAVYFLSVYQAQRMAGRPDTVVVSIRDKHFTPKLKPGFLDVLPLHFDDQDAFRGGHIQEIDRFTNEHADALRTWMSKHLVSPSPLIFMVHCRAGISRSAAVAWWVHREFWIPLRTTFPTNRLNRNILSVLNPSLAHQHLADEKSTSNGARSKGFDLDCILYDDVWQEV